MGNTLYLKLKDSHFWIGIACVLAIPIWLWGVVPHLIDLPEDFSYAADIVSIDNFFDQERGEYAGDIYSSTTYTFDTVSTEAGLSIVRNVFRVASYEGVPIFFTERLYGIDQKTGAHVAGFGDRDREGYLFAPQHLKRGEPFTYWHINYDGPAVMQFVEEQVINELPVYKYETSYEDVLIDQTENLTHLPDVGVSKGVALDPYLEVWVEPVSGRIVKYRDDTTAYFYDLSTGERLSPWNHFSNIVANESVDALVTEAQWQKTKMRTFEYYIPFLLGLMSLLFLAKSFSAQNYVRENLSLDKIVDSIAGFTLLLAVVSFTGWVVDVEALTRIIPYASAMNPLTALSFMLVAVALLFRKKAVHISYFLGSTLLVISIVRFLGIFDIISFQVDLVLFGDKIKSYPVLARMAAYTSASFGMVGVLLISSRNQLLRRLYCVELFSIVVFIFSLFALAGYFFGSLEILELPVFFSAAIHTAFLFFVLSIGFYVAYHKIEENSLVSWFSVAIVLFVTLSVALMFAGMTERKFADENRVQFETDVSRVTDALLDRMEVYVHSLEGGIGLFAASDHVSRDEWGKYVTAVDIQTNYPGIQGLGYSIFVSPENKETHVQAIREEGFPEYTIRPEGVRDIYTTILYIDPFDEKNRQAFGYDMYSNQVRRSAMEQARDTGIAKMTGRITLVQEIEEADIQSGFLVYVPVYKNGMSHATVAERRDSIVGYVYAPFRATDFVQATMRDLEIGKIGLSISDGIKKTQGDELYSNITKDGIDNISGKLLKKTKTVYVAGRPWTLTFVESSSLNQTLFKRIMPGLILIVGIIVSLLASISVYVLTSSRQKALVAVEKATKDLREAKAKDDAILASIGEGVVVADTTGKLIYWNDSAEEILGTKLDQTPKDQWEEKYGIFYPDEVTAMPGEKQALALALQGQVIKNMPEFVRNENLKQGRHIKVTAVPIHLEDKTLLGAVAIFRDVTHETEVDKAKTEFVSLASHQLRTPLSVINWYSEMLLNGDAGTLTEAQISNVKEIYTGSRRMTDLVNALLNVSRLELGTFMVEPVDMNIMKLAEEEVKAQKIIADKKQITIQTEFAKNIPQSIQADPKLLGMVFQNLFSNAIKYTPEKGSVTCNISYLEKTTEISIDISDTGFGIPKDQQDKIFSKLFRADNVTEKDTEGTGLGLYIVKGIIENARGKIWFDSVEDKGTTFHIVLPIDGMQKKAGNKRLE